ncbi:MAG: imidazoleglycerol-phosphate dehydratase HisB [Campylobacterales bacterium]|nr:imidazoleglycerol-phosphate dehydratase HisB [Campylobacterales bacterium]
MEKFNRETKETKINASFELYGSGKSEIKTGVGFFDHMLEALTKHSLTDLTLTCDGDTHVDFHHTVEDVAIVIGELLNKTIYPVGKVERFANRVVALDEAAVEVIIDLSGRPYIHFDVPMNGNIGEFDSELVEEFFRALVLNAKITAHIVIKRGTNKHHIAEAAFKAFAVALRDALKPNERMNSIPSTKGVL